MNSGEILNLCQMGENSRVFSLGLFDRKVTIYAQQLRGFNLAWALIESGLATAGSRVAIVGGGAAGISAAVALTSAEGVAITLFEAATHLMALQQNNGNRFIQPNIYDWPDTPETSTVALPDLQWRSGLAGEVQKAILGRFSAYADRIETRCGITVRSWKSRDGRVELRFRPTRGCAPEALEEFDVVILALGFGVERGPGGRATLSYWSNDIMNQVGPGRYLIHGVGDGGLTDAMRLAILDLSHREILLLFQRSPVATALGKSLQAAEARLQMERSRARIDEARHREHHHRLYAETAPVPSLCDYLAAHLRPEVVVSLYSKGNMYAPNASILNKLIVRHLEAIGAVRWCPQSELDRERKRARSFYRIGSKRRPPDLARSRPAGFDPSLGRELGSVASFPHEYFRLSHAVTQPRILVLMSRVDDPGAGGDPYASPNSDTQQSIGRHFDEWAEKELGQRARWLLKSFDPRPSCRPAILRTVRELRDDFDVVLAHGSDIGVALFGDGSAARVDEVIEAAGGKPVVFFGARSGLREDVLANRPVYVAEQAFDLERLRNLLQIGFPNGDLFFVSSDRYPVDAYFFERFACLVGNAALRNPGHFRFHLHLVAEESFRIEQLPEGRLYVGRFFAHYLGHTHAVMGHRTFLSSYEVDLNVGAVATMDSSAEDCASLIVEQILIPLIQSESPEQHIFPVSYAQITVSKRNAERRGLQLNEAFLNKARVVT